MEHCNCDYYGIIFIFDTQHNDNSYTSFSINYTSLNYHAIQYLLTLKDNLLVFFAVCTNKIILYTRLVKLVLFVITIINFRITIAKVERLKTTL